MEQTTFKSERTGETQCQAILNHLEQHRGKWVAMPDLVRVSGAYAVHSRISDLRARGHHIVQRNERSGRTVKSFYLLVASSLDGSPEERTVQE